MVIYYPSNNNFGHHKSERGKGSVSCCDTMVYSNSLYLSSVLAPNCFM